MLSIRSNEYAIWITQQKQETKQEMNRNLSFQDLQIISHQLLDFIFDKLWSKKDMLLLLKLITYVIENMEDW